MNNKRTLTWVFVALSVLLAFVVFLLSQQVRHMQRAGEFRSHRIYRPFSATTTMELPSAFAPEDVRIWMTFAFINQALGLSPEYLKEQLHISDSDYPNISVRKAAGEQSVTPDAFLASLRAAVQTYGGSGNR